MLPMIDIKNKFLFFLFFFIILTSSSQSIFGKWNTLNSENNTIESVIEIYEKNGRAYAKIISISDPKKRSVICLKCAGNKKNKPILGMDILSGLIKNNTEWSGGKILDPRNGKEYKCYIKLLDSNSLKLRGYIGFSVFGRTEIWKRATTQ